MTSTSDADFDCSSEASYTCYTPAETIISETMSQPAAAPAASNSSQVDYPPQKGKTFIIISHDKNDCILELVRGKLQVSRAEKAGLGIAWHCVKSSGWYGFVNTVSGGYLGHDGEMKMRASMPQHKGFEWFTIDKHRDGGYVLLVALKGVLHEMGVAKDSKSLVVVKEGGTAWNFIEVPAINIPKVSGLVEFLLRL